MAIGVRCVIEVLRDDVVKMTGNTFDGDFSNAAWCQVTCKTDFGTSVVE